MRRLKFTFFTLAFILILLVLFMTWKDSLASLQGWNRIAFIGSDEHNAVLGLNLTMKVKESESKSIQAINMERQTAIRDFCKRKNRTDEPLDTKNLAYIIVAEKFKILFCYIPKVACTEWKTVMTRLRVTGDQWKPIIESLNRGDRDTIHDHRNIRFLNSYPRDEAERMLKSYFKFVFLRDPFERFLSAYLNKFQTWNNYYYQHFGRHIIKQYRPGHPNDKNVTFDEFVQYVINSGGTGWDPHWQTYDRLCHPCAIHYDFIGKFENLEEEARHVLEISNISRELNVSFPQVRPSSTSLKVPLYFSQIPKERLFRIVQLYSGDSEMFQYDLPKFLRERITGAD